MLYNTQICHIRGFLHHAAPAAKTCGQGTGVISDGKGRGVKLLHRAKPFIAGLFKYPPFYISFWALALISVIVFILVYFFVRDAGEYLLDVLVEAHGLVFDLLVLGVLASIFSYIAQRHERIARYNEEIDDFRGWRSPEAMYRIVGNIQRLNREGVQPVNLADVYLKGAELSGFNLSHMNLSGAILHNARLEKADLNAADLHGAALIGVDLNEAYLYRTNFEGADLRWADLHGANLREANLREADLQWTNFQGADLRGASFRAANFQGADLRGANLGDADLQWAKLCETDLYGADLHGADLTRVRYNSAPFQPPALPDSIVFGPTRWPHGFTPSADAIDISVDQADEWYQT
jgi:uncharacterized protein YjbI with pentapeptide repeats